MQYSTTNETQSQIKYKLQHQRFKIILKFDIVRHISTLLTEIIKTSKSQNSAWLCGFSDVTNN